MMASAAGTYWQNHNSLEDSILKSITIKDIKLHTIALPFVEPLKTSFGNDPVKATVLVEVITAEGVSGWGEIV